MTVIAAEYLGLAAERIKAELDDTLFPPASVQGGVY